LPLGGDDGAFLELPVGVADRVPVTEVLSVNSRAIVTP
jgi:hypothetical protein